MNIHFRLRHKFALVFTPLLLIIIAFGIFGIRTFFSINQIFLELKQDIAPSAFAMMEFKEVLVSLEAAINAREINREEIEGQISRLKILLKKHLPRDEQEDHLDDSAKKSAQEMRDRAIRVMSLARYILNLTENSWQSEEIARLYASIHQEQSQLGTILEEKLSAHLQELSLSEKAITDKYRLCVFIIWYGIAIGIGIALFMIFYMARTVLTPITVLQEGAKQIGDGCLNYRLELKTGDEFEALADEFKSMASKLGELYANLDRKVLARTQELSLANRDLTKEIGEREKAEAQVHTLTQELIKVQEIERKRIALDLHDNVAQELSAMKALTDSLCVEQTIDQTKLRKRMVEWSEVMSRCVGTVRELSYNLMPPALGHLGIKTAISSYCRDFSKKNGIAVDFTSAGMDRLSLSLDYDVAINLYRLVQEALNNVKKHAGACQVKVSLVSSGSNIVLHIEDNGQGCDLHDVRERSISAKRLGLLGMQERVTSLAGSIEISSRPHEGMTVFIEIPLEKEHGNENHDTAY